MPCFRTVCRLCSLTHLTLASVILWNTPVLTGISPSRRPGKVLTNLAEDNEETRRWQSLTKETFEYPITQTFCTLAESKAERKFKIVFIMA